MKIIDKFTEKQIDVLKSIDIFLDGSDYSDEEIFNIDSKVSRNLMLLGFDGEDINYIGRELLSILDLLAEL